MQVRWTRKALSNLEDAIRYIAVENPSVAKDVAEKIWKASRMLEAHPEIGRPGRVTGTRELVIAGLPFILPYEQKGGSIFVLRIMHSSMKWPDSFG